jgi:putative membrane protein
LLRSQLYRVSSVGAGLREQGRRQRMFEIQSSQLALSKQADEDTKPFAQKMVQDHQKTSSELKGVVEGSMVRLTLPTALDSEHQKMLNDRLGSPNGS